MDEVCGEVKVGNFAQNPIFLDPLLKVKGKWHDKLHGYRPAVLAAGGEMGQSLNCSHYRRVDTAIDALENANITRLLNGYCSQNRGNTDSLLNECHDSRAAAATW